MDSHDIHDFVKQLLPSDKAVFAAQKLDPHAQIDPKVSSPESPLGLVWSDEVPRRGGLSNEGWRLWKMLLVVRRQIHGGYPLTGEARRLWNDAKETVKWIGFSRLTLTPEEQAIYDKMKPPKSLFHPQQKQPTVLDLFKELIN